VASWAPGGWPVGRSGRVNTEGEWATCDVVHAVYVAGYTALCSSARDLLAVVVGRDL